MAWISRQLKLAANKTDIENLATKGDFATINDGIDAQGEEIMQIREELTQYKKDFDGLPIVLKRKN